MVTLWLLGASEDTVAYKWRTPARLQKKQPGIKCSDNCITVGFSLFLCLICPLSQRNASAAEGECELQIVGRAWMTLHGTLLLSFFFNLSLRFLCHCHSASAPFPFYPPILSSYFFHMQIHTNVKKNIWQNKNLHKPGLCDSVSSWTCVLQLAEISTL